MRIFNQIDEILKSIGIVLTGFIILFIAIAANALSTFIIIIINISNAIFALIKKYCIRIYYDHFKL